MKVLHRHVAKNAEGKVKLIPEEAEDMWNIYNLIDPGDKVKANTVRKVQKEGALRGTSKIAKHTAVVLEVLKVDYDAEGNELSIKGRNCEENELLKIGSFHTLKITLNMELSLFKDQWDPMHLYQLNEAIHCFNRSELAVVLIELGVAKLFLLTASLVKEVFSIQSDIPKMRNYASAHETAKVRFFEKVLGGMLAHINFDVVKCILIAGPGFTKDAFYEWMKKEAVEKVHKQILSKRDIILTAKASCVYKQALNEIMTNESVKRLLSDTKAISHVQALDTFYKTMKSDPNRICYGLQHTQFAVKSMVVETLMVTNSLFRSCDLQVRKNYVSLVEQAKACKAVVHIFSDMHVSGEQLNHLSGIAAMLRQPLPNLQFID